MMSRPQRSVLLFTVVAVTLSGSLAVTFTALAEPRVWWSRYAAEATPSSEQQLLPLSNSASRDFHSSPSASQYRPQSWGSAASGWGSKASDSYRKQGGGGASSGSSWGGKQKSPGSSLDILTGGVQYQDWNKQSLGGQKDSGSWSDYQDSGTGWGSNTKKNQGYGKRSAKSDQQYLDSSSQYQDYGSSLSNKKNNQASGKGSSWSGQQLQEIGQWSDKQYQDYDYYQDTGADYNPNKQSGGKSKYNDLLERVQDLEKKVYEMYLQKEKLTTKVWELANSAKSASTKAAPQRQIVSFTALASKNLPYLKHSEVIVFDEVLVNNGGAYDAHSGIFYAPVPGVYLFSASILSGFNSTIETMITLNGQEAALLYSGGFKNRGSGTNTVVLNLRKGDEVAVAVFYENGNYVHGKWSTFSGTLLETY